MSIKTSIYDFLAYALPGAIILLILLHAGETYGLAPYYTQLISSNFSNWFVFGIVSYLAGFILEPLVNYVTDFYSPAKKAKILAHESMLKRNPELKINLNPLDWAFWFATIRRENLDLAYEIDRLNAQSKMMKGVSSAALLFLALLLSYVLLGKCPVYFLAFIPFVVLISFLSIRQANRFKQMFFLIIYETVISREEPFTKRTTNP